MEKKDAGFIHITRDDNDMPLASTLLTSTIAALNETDYLNDTALFEVSVPSSDDRTYLSKSVSWKTILSKVQELLMRYFDTLYKHSRYNAVGEYLSGKMTGDVNEDTSTVNQFVNCVSYSDLGENIVWDFINESPTVWNDVFALAIEDLRINGEIEKMKDDIRFLYNDKVAFSPSMEFQTTISTFQTETGGTRSTEYLPKSLSQGYSRGDSGLHTGFVLAFFKSNMISTSYKCPSNGVLVLYGWLDTSNVADLAYLPTGWCALEGYINNRWEIIQLQQVVPNKQYSYVSFTVPVLADLMVRVRLGFPPGEASGRYGSSNVVNSLGNHVPNAFIGGVYKAEPSNSSDLNINGMAFGGLLQSRTVVFNNVVNKISGSDNLSDYVMKSALSDLIPSDFYPKSLSYTREQIGKALGYHVEKCDVCPEISISTKNGAKIGDDDKPVNRIAVWNFSKRGEEPVGTVIENICKPDKNGFLLGRPEWKYCDGSSLDAETYQELASMMGVSSGKIVLPDFSDEKIPHYVKVASSYSGCETAGWSRGMLKKSGIETSVQKKDWRKDSTINSIFDQRDGKYHKIL